MYTKIMGIIIAQNVRALFELSMASTISSLIGEVMITSSDGDYLREVTSRW